MAPSGGSLESTRVARQGVPGYSLVASEVAAALDFRAGTLPGPPLTLVRMTSDDTARPLPTRAIETYSALTPEQTEAVLELLAEAARNDGQQAVSEQGRARAAAATNPYGAGAASAAILDIVREAAGAPRLKRFVDRPGPTDERRDGEEQE